MQLTTVDFAPARLAPNAAGIRCCVQRSKKAGRCGEILLLLYTCGTAVYEYSYTRYKSGKIRMSPSEAAAEEKAVDQEVVDVEADGDANADADTAAMEQRKARESSSVFPPNRYVHTDRERRTGATTAIINAFVIIYKRLHFVGN